MTDEIPQEAVKVAAEAIALGMIIRNSPRQLAWDALEAAAPLLAGEPITEHAQLMSGGGFHVWNTGPHIEEIYPLAERIRHGQQHGGKVYRRRVIVVEDWTELPATAGKG